MRSLAWLAVLLAEIACSHPAPPRPVALANQVPMAPSAPVPPTTYRAPHPVQVVCDKSPDGWCEEQDEDRLTMRETPDGSVTVAIELVRTNAHTCSFEGTLRRAPDETTQRWTFQEQNDEGACSIVLERTDTALILESEGCRYYCGARASLNATFPVPPR